MPGKPSRTASPDALNLSAVTEPSLEHVKSGTLNQKEHRQMTSKDRLEISIAKRYDQECAKLGVDPSERMDTMMTLHFANQDDSLDYNRLLSFDSFNFMHDVCGMLRHMNRKTTKLGDCFVPRCAVPQTIPA